MIALVESDVITIFLKLRFMDFCKATNAPIISGWEDDFLADVVKTSFNIEDSEKITAVAVLVRDLALTKDQSTPIKIISSSISSLFFSNITFEESVLSSSIFSRTSSLETVVRLCLCMPSISLSFVSFL